jgi:hypothetical protein
MSIDFKFQHNQLSATVLRSLGITNFKELEEVILGESFWEKLEIDDETIFVATGFTSKVKALKVAFKYDKDLTFNTLQAALATVDQIKFDFCKFCK